MRLHALVVLSVALAPCGAAWGQGQTPPIPTTPPAAPPAPPAAQGQTPPAPAVAPIAPTAPSWPVEPPLVDEDQVRSFAERAKEMATMQMDMNLTMSQDAIRKMDDNARVLADQASALADLAPLATLDAEMSAQYARDRAQYGGNLTLFGDGLPNGGPRAAWIQGDPADSIYRSAREALNRGDYRPAARQFAECTTKYPNSRYIADCGYWQAFALYRIGTMDDLHAAAQALDAIAAHSAQLSKQIDVAALRTRINSALAVRGDAQAADQLRKDAQQAGKAACDQEDISVRVEALSTLSQMDPETVLPTLRTVLGRKDDCSVELRRQAISLVARRNDTTAAEILGQSARNDPDKSVQQTAIDYLGRLPGAVSFNALDELLKSTTDENTQMTIIDAMGQSPDPRAKQALRSILEHATSDRVQVRAIRAISGDRSITYYAPYANGRAGQIIQRPIMLNDANWSVAYPTPAAVAAMKATAPPAPAGAPAAASPARGGRGGGRGAASSAQGRPAASPAQGRPADDDEAYLRGFYPKAKSDAVKEALISAVASYTGDQTQPFLLGIAGNAAESSDVRAFALGRIGRTSITIAQISKLYDQADSRSMREQLITVLATRTEPEASDKLFEIVKLGTDPELQKDAIRALTNKKDDPRATKLLNDLIAGKPPAGGR